MTPENEKAAPGQQSQGGQIDAERDGDDSDRSRIEQLRGYVRRGWALVPLHSVDPLTGACSCWAGAYPEHKSAGKHPLASRWQHPEHLVTTEAALFGVLESRPRCNWGLATGLLSGVWAIDYDPAAVLPHEREVAEAFLLQLVAIGTWTQRTGSGGQHWLFTLPADFVPNNSAGRLPSGFDVRGARAGQPTGGQIVLAPSVSGVGAYEVLGDPAAPVLPAPAAVLELLRPPPPRERRAHGMTVPIGADTVQRYVATAIAGEVTQLEATAVRRNDRAWRAAVRVQELTNTGLVDREAAYAAWWAAAAAHPDPSVRVPDRELLSVWASAERTVGDRPADLSGVGGPSGWGGTAILPFAAPGAAPPLGGGGPGGSYPQPVDNYVYGTGGTDSVTAVTPGITDRTGAVTLGGVGEVPLSHADLLWSMLLDVEALRALPAPKPLINGVLDLDTTAWLIGASGSYKSFVALDFAAHVGLGRSWRGHEVHQGEVVYVVAEGARGMRLRVDAWEREYGPIKGIRFLPVPVQAGDAEAWAGLVEVCRRIAPALVVIDTQARVTLGLDENSNSDMGRYVEAADRIKRATGACVLTVHHLGRAGTNARGASAIDGAQDAELRVKRLGQQFIELHMDKQKDQQEQPPIALRLRRSEAGTDEDTGRDLSSLVVDHDEVPSLGEPESSIPAGERRAIALYQLIATVFGRGEGGTRADIRALFMGLPEIEALTSPATRRKAWHVAWGLLVSRGRVCRFEGAARFTVFAPPDGAAAGVLTMNTGGPDDVPPEGWVIHWPESDRADNVVDWSDSPVPS